MLEEKAKFLSWNLRPAQKGLRRVEVFVLDIHHPCLLLEFETCSKGIKTSHAGTSSFLNRSTSGLEFETCSKGIKTASEDLDTFPKVF